MALQLEHDMVLLRLWEPVQRRNNYLTTQVNKTVK